MSTSARLTIGFLHTASAHVSRFDALLEELLEKRADQGHAAVHTAHVVDESLLDDARTHGLTDALRDRIAQRVAEAGAHATVVVCTCSTIGAAAEDAGRINALRVLRVDSPMAEEAVRLGRHIVVIATVESTLAPTTELLTATARRSGRSASLTTVLATEAWPLFERGDLDGYYRAVATRIDQVAPPCDAIVLAQASMSPAAAWCRTAIPVLSSPRLAMVAALEMLAPVSG